MLDGGYEQFAMQYPKHVTDSSWKRSIVRSNQESIQHGDEYNSIDEIKMKDSISASVALQLNPSDAAEEFQYNRTQLDLLLHREHELLLFQTMRENELSAIVDILNISKSDEEQMQNKQHILQNEIIHLDDAYYDICDQIEFYQRKIDVYARKKELVDEECNLMMQLFEKLQALHSEWEQKHAWNQRQIALREQREEKRLGEERQRECQAESRGLTGLSNLGNSCYMNSIFQCLLNVVPLRVYLISEAYRRHIIKWA